MRIGDPGAPPSRAVTLTIGAGIAAPDIEAMVEQDTARVQLGGTGDSVRIEGILPSTTPRLVAAGARTVDIKI